MLLLLLLFWQIRLARTEARIEALETAILEAEDESARLMIQEESSLTLENVEQKAIRNLGLRHPEAEQITVMDRVG